MPQIDLDKHNEAVLADVDHDREMKVKLQQKIAEMVEDFNRLNHEQRYCRSGNRCPPPERNRSGRSRSPSRSGRTPSSSAAR